MTSYSFDLKKLRREAEAICRDDYGSRFHCVAAYRCESDQGEIEHRVEIEECSPDATEVQRDIGEKLAQRGFPYVTVSTAW